jgi:hypothetical protein
VWICLVIMLGLTALAARLKQRGHRPHHQPRPLRPRQAAPACMVVRSHYNPAYARRSDERKDSSRPGRRVSVAGRCPHDGRR